MIQQTGPNWKTLGQGFVFDVIPISVIVMLIAAVILWVLLDQTVVGRKFMPRRQPGGGARLRHQPQKVRHPCSMRFLACSSVWRRPVYLPRQLRRRHRRAGP